MKENKHIDGSSGVSPLGPSQRVKAAVRKAVKKINGVPAAETDRLKRLFHSKFGLSTESVLFANSLKELIYLIPEVFHPARVLIVGPAFPGYEDAARSVGAEVTYLTAREEEGFAFDISRMHECMREIDLVFLASPNSITGKLIPWEQLREIVHWQGFERAHFVIDEALIEFAGRFDYPVDLIGTGNVTLLRTTAFFYGLPGLELASAVSSPEVIRLYEKKKRWEINLLAVEAARMAYKDTSFRKASARYMLIEKKSIIRMLNRIEGLQTYDTDSNMILVKAGKIAREIVHILGGKGIEIKDCGGIAGLDDSFFRISVMKHEHNLKVISVLKGLEETGNFSGIE